MFYFMIVLVDYNTDQSYSRLKQFYYFGRNTNAPGGPIIVPIAFSITKNTETLEEIVEIKAKLVEFVLTFKLFQEVKRKESQL